MEKINKKWLLISVALLILLLFLKFAVLIWVISIIFAYQIHKSSADNKRKIKQYLLLIFVLLLTLLLFYRWWAILLVIDDLMQAKTFPTSLSVWIKIISWIINPTAF